MVNSLGRNRINSVILLVSSAHFSTVIGAKQNDISSYNLAPNSAIIETETFKLINIQHTLVVLN